MQADGSAMRRDYNEMFRMWRRYGGARDEADEAGSEMSLKGRI
jgi:hypothetical protein